MFGMFFLQRVAAIAVLRIVGKAEALVLGGSMLECGTSGIQEGEKTSNAIMMKLERWIGSQWLVRLGMEGGIAGHTPILFTQAVGSLALAITNAKFWQDDRTWTSSKMAGSEFYGQLCSSTSLATDSPGRSSEGFRAFDHT